MATDKSGKDILISTRNVSFAFWRRSGWLRKERFWALKDVSFDLRKGETLGIIGRNGAGKSTMLKLLAGIVDPNSGSIKNFGVKAALLTPQLGFTPYLTGRQNAFLSGMLLGRTLSEITERMDEIIEFSELGDFIDQPYVTYSSGMRSRLGFSVAIQMDPDVLLVDEVLGAGDAEFRKKSTNAMIKRIESDKTIVMVSHSVELLERICDRAVWIEKGVSVAAGDAKSVMKEYVASQK